MSGEFTEAAYQKWAKEQEMSMEKEWKELKKHVLEMRGIEVDKAYLWTTYNDLLIKMDELERRRLPERVAELLENLDPIKVDAAYMTTGFETSGEMVGFAAAKALRTGDTSELEKWTK